MKQLSEKQAREYLAKYEPAVRYKSFALFKIARICALNALDREDLDQIGRMAVIEAISIYCEPSVAEETFVRVRIFQRMVDAIRANSYLSRDEIHSIERRYKEKLPRDSNLKRGQLADHIVSLPLDSKIFFSNPDWEGYERHELIPDPNPGLAADETIDKKRASEWLQKQLSKLTPQQSAALRCGLFENTRLLETGKRIGISDSRVCQLQKAAVTNLARKYQACFANE